MLVSQQHGYLFIHVAKTGGTSIRAALTVGRWRDPRNWPLWVAHRASSLTGHRIAAKLPRHAAVIAAQEMLPADLFATLFKFGFVRNPWDRLVSAYSHFQRERTDVLAQNQIQTFAEFVDHILYASPAEVMRGTLIRAIQRPQIESFVGLHGELLADFVGRYESLREDFEAIMQRLSLPHVLLPHKRCGKRQRDYRTSYNDALAERVATHYQDDLQAFGYQFDDATAPALPDSRSQLELRYRPTGTDAVDRPGRLDTTATISFADHAVTRRPAERSD